jgi:hypothetical protein
LATAEIILPDDPETGVLSRPRATRGLSDQPPPPRPTLRRQRVEPIRQRGDERLRMRCHAKHCDHDSEGEAL